MSHALASVEEASCATASTAKSKPAQSATQAALTTSRGRRAVAPSPVLMAASLAFAKAAVAAGIWNALSNDAPRCSQLRVVGIVSTAARNASRAPPRSPLWKRGPA